tara:strand:+ start:1109 stop:1549 length:441 start_codon:yes stop_codon:yes gene_type:complete
MKLILGCDHAAFEEKEVLKSFLQTLGHDIVDVGTYSNERCDYPDFAEKAVKEILAQSCLGILLCGSGIGISMAANRFSDIRAALCRSVKEAELSRQHNDANVLCLGARINSSEELAEITSAWLKATFEGGRHSDRVAKFNNWGTKI